MIISKDNFCGKIQKTYQTITYVMELYDLVEARPLVGADLKTLLFDFENYESGAEKVTGS